MAMKDEFSNLGLGARIDKTRASGRGLMFKNPGDA